MPTKHLLEPFIKERWSPRNFSDKPVDKKTLLLLLESARWAPSSRNEQPWRFFIATKDEPEAYQRIFNCLGAYNQGWAITAPVLLVSVAKMVLEREGFPPNNSAKHDVGLAIGGMMAQATSMGLCARQMGGFDKAMAKEVLGIPENFEAVTVTALGYLADGEIMPERARQPLSDLVFFDEWGKSPDWL